ncbi:MAG TPA: sugar ABC transporter permease [Candidatus Dormibacteraeota bacterium]
MCAVPSADGAPGSAAAAAGPRTGTLTRRRLSRRRLPRRAAPYLLIAPALVVIAAVMAYPMGFLASLSLQDYGLRELLAHQGVWAGAANYARLASDPLFWQVVARSLAFTATAVLLSMVLATLLALLMERCSGPVRLLLGGGLIFVWATPVVVAVDIWQWMFDYEFGVANWALTHLHLGSHVHHNWFENPVEGFAIITALVVWGALPFLVVTLYAGLVQVPLELVEAARSDGATAWQVFWQVTAPLLRPIFAIVLSLSTIWDFQVFNQVWIMLNQRPSSTYYVMGVYSYVEAFRVTQYGRGAAVSIVLVAILMLATFFYVRQMARTGELE